MAEAAAVPTCFQSDSSSYCAKPKVKGCKPSAAQEDDDIFGDSPAETNETADAGDNVEQTDAAEGHQYKDQSAAWNSPHLKGVAGYSNLVTKTFTLNAATTPRELLNKDGCVIKVSRETMEKLMQQKPRTGSAKRHGNVSKMMVISIMENKFAKNIDDTVYMTISAAKPRNRVILQNEPMFACSSVMAGYTNNSVSQIGGRRKLSALNSMQEYISVDVDNMRSQMKPLPVEKNLAPLCYVEEGSDLMDMIEGNAEQYGHANDFGRHEQFDEDGNVALVNRSVPIALAASMLDDLDGFKKSAKVDNLSELKVTYFMKGDHPDIDLDAPVKISQELDIAALWV